MRSEIAGTYAMNALVDLTMTPVAVKIESPNAIAIGRGETRTVDVAISNVLGGFNGGLTSIAIGAARSVHMRLRPRDQHVFNIQVPEGSPLLLAELTSISPSLGDVDLYLFDCTGKRCRPTGAAMNLGAPPRLRQVNPKPGLWKVVIDASRVPREGVTINYVDAVADPQLGGLTVTDGVRRREVGAQWTTKGNVWLAKVPDAGRNPVALLTVNATMDGTTVPVCVRLVTINLPTNASASANKRLLVRTMPT